MAWQSRRIAADPPGPVAVVRRVVEWRQAADRARLLTSTDATLRVRRQDLPAGRWFREYMTYDPAADLVAIDRPVLAVTGGKDVQVDPADVAAIGRWSPDRSRVRRPMTSHMSCAAITTRRAAPLRETAAPR